MRYKFQLNNLVKSSKSFSGSYGGASTAPENINPGSDGRIVIERGGAYLRQDGRMTHVTHIDDAGNVGGYTDSPDGTRCTCVTTVKSLADRAVKRVN